MGFDDARWNTILENSPWSDDAILVYLGVEYPVRVDFGEGWSRKEIDGRKVTAEPLATLSVMMHKDSLPSAVPRTALASLAFIIGDAYYTVKNYTGSSLIRFYLQSSTEPEIEEVVPPVDDGDGESEGEGEESSDSAFHGMME